MCIGDGTGSGRGEVRSSRRGEYGRESNGTNGDGGVCGAGGRITTGEGGDLAAAAGGVVGSTKAGEGDAPTEECLRCRKKGHRTPDHAVKLCSRCHGWSFTAALCPTAKKMLCWR